MLQNGDNPPAIQSSSETAPSVLVVEDEVLIRTLVAEELRSAGFTVIEAANADEAIGVLATGANISLVLTDFAMPGSMSGLQLAANVRQRLPGLPIVLVSGHGAPPPDAPWINAFFRKPYDVTAVIRAIEGLLGRAPPNEAELTA